MSRAKPYVWASFALMIINGICRGLVDEELHAVQVIDVITGIVFGICVYLWCRADAETRQLGISGRYAGLVGLGGILGVTFYVFHTTPRGRKWLRFLKGLLIFVLTMLSSYVVEVLVLATMDTLQALQG